MEEHRPRPLTATEAAALVFILGADFPGFAELREQAKSARVVGRCSRGCPSIDLEVDRASVPPALTAKPGMAAWADSRDPRTDALLLWVDGDYLAGLELSWFDGPPDVFPPPGMFDPPKRG